MNRQKSSSYKNELTVNYDLSPFMPHNTNMNRSISFENEVITFFVHFFKINFAENLHEIAYFSFLLFLLKKE